MPELPDILVYTDRLLPRVVGEPLPRLLKGDRPRTLEGLEEVIPARAALRRPGDPHGRGR